MNNELTLAEEEDIKINIAPHEKKEKKVNKDFMQLYLNAHDYLIQLIDKSPTAAKIFLLMMKFCEANNTVYLPTKSIMEALNITRQQTISDAIKILKENGYIAIYKYGKNNFYFINPTLTANCDVHYKKKLLNTFEECDKEELVKLNKKVVNTTKIKKEDGIKLKIGFYKVHQDLQKPTREEIEQQEEREELLNEVGPVLLEMEESNKKYKKQKKEFKTEQQKKDYEEALRISEMLKNPNNYIRI